MLSLALAGKDVTNPSFHWLEHVQPESSSSSSKLPHETAILRIRSLLTRSYALLCVLVCGSFLLKVQVQAHVMTAPLANIIIKMSSLEMHVLEEGSRGPSTGKVASYCRSRGHSMTVLFPCGGSDGEAEEDGEKEVHILFAFVQ